MSSASSSSAAEAAAHSCVHAGKVFFSVCFTGGQGYRGGKRNVAGGGSRRKGGRGGGTRVLRATTTLRTRIVLFLSSFFFLSLFFFMHIIGVSFRIEINSGRCAEHPRPFPCEIMRTRRFIFDSANWSVHRRDIAVSFGRH